VKKFRVNKYTFLHEKQILQHFVIEHGDYVDDKIGQHNILS